MHMCVYVGWGGGLWTRNGRFFDWVVLKTFDFTLLRWIFSTLVLLVVTSRIENAKGTLNCLLLKLFQADNNIAASRVRIRSGALSSFTPLPAWCIAQLNSQPSVNDTANGSKPNILFSLFCIRPPLTCWWRISVSMYTWIPGASFSKILKSSSDHKHGKTSVYQGD